MALRRDWQFRLAIICLTFIAVTVFPVADKQFRSMAVMLKSSRDDARQTLQADKPRLHQEMLTFTRGEDNPLQSVFLPSSKPGILRVYKCDVGVEMRNSLRAVIRLFRARPMTPVTCSAAAVDPPVFPPSGLPSCWHHHVDTVQAQRPADGPVRADFSFMPWILMFVMATFATGLQLYWVVPNLLTIAQQWWLYKRYDLHLSDTHPVKT